jgi:hypothetical protein
VDLPPIEPAEPVDELEGCGFAGAAAAQEDQCFAAGDLKCHRRKDFAAAQAAGDVFEANREIIQGRAFRPASS